MTSNGAVREPEINICDALMGSGKTQAAIRYMNEHDDLFIYITPYLAETQRIIRDCPERRFAAPADLGDGKLDDFRRLIKERRNVASTHALFLNMDMSTIELISECGYTLILDEVIEPFSKLSIKKKDIDFALNQGIIQIDEDTGIVVCDDSKLSGFGNYGIFQTIKRLCDCRNLFHSRGAYLFSIFPETVFRAFKKVYILTYMFKAQSLCHYFRFVGLEYRYIGVEEIAGSEGEREFYFTDAPVEKYYPWLKEKIHISIYSHQNKIGHALSALSSSWYYRRKNKGNPDIDILRRNLITMLRSIYGCTSKEAIWTCFKTYTRLLGKTGYASSFVTCTMRSSNAYRDRKYLAYLCNIYRNPYIKSFFEDKGISVEENAFAVSEMVQWVFRSAIRDKKDVYIYVPSRRMRSLLREWIEQNSVRHEPVEKKQYKKRETKKEKAERLDRERLENMPDFGDDKFAKKLWIAATGTKNAEKTSLKSMKQMALAMDYYNKKEKR